MLSVSRIIYLLAATTLFAVPLLSGCGEDPKPATTTASVPCATQDDCAQENTFCDMTLKKCVKNTFAADATTSGDGGAIKDGSDGGGSTDDTAVSDTAANLDAKADSTTQDTTPASNDKSCKKCSTDTDCPSDHGCVPLLSGSFCAKKCGSVQDCTPGYICDKVTQTEQKHCVLPSYDCKGCATDGCPTDQQCNYKTNPPSCLEVKKQCETCLQDKDCGNGLRCVKFGDNSKACLPDCGAGQACPTNSACVSYVTEQTKACAFAAAKCCYGPACTSGCADCKTTCVAGKCAECIKNSDCGAGSCNLNTYTCVTSATCPPAAEPTKKIKLSATGECVECTNDTHCAGATGGPKCNAQKHVCEKGGGVGECAACGGDYPGCVEINGVWSCVECATDDDCAKKNKGTCIAKSYTCSGSVGGGTGGVIGPKTGTCKSDTDCPKDPNGTFELICDTGSGLCFDKNGKCDNVIAFCNAAAGSTCELNTDLLGGLGGAGGGIPGLPGGSGGGTPAPNAGSCTCGTGGGSGGTGSGYKFSQTCELVKALVPSLAKCDCSKDPNSADCQPLGALPIPIPGLPSNCCEAVSGGGGGSSTPSDPLTCMLGGISGKPDPMCFGGISCSTLLSCISGKPGGTCGSGLGL